MCSGYFEVEGFGQMVRAVYAVGARWFKANEVFVRGSVLLVVQDF